MDPQPSCPTTRPPSRGQVQYFQKSDSNEDHKSKINAKSDTFRATPGIDGPTSPSSHAVFNLDTRAVIDANIEHPDSIDHRYISQHTLHQADTKNKDSKPPSPPKKISASWKTEWSEDTFKNETKSNKGNILSHIYSHSTYFSRPKMNIFTYII